MRDHSSSKNLRRRLSDPSSPPRKKCKDALWTLVTGWKHPNATTATDFASFLYVCQSRLLGRVLKKRTKRLSSKALWSIPHPTWFDHRYSTDPLHLCSGSSSTCPCPHDGPTHSTLDHAKEHSLHVIARNEEDVVIGRMGNSILRRLCIPEHHQILYEAVANIWRKGAEALQEQGGQVGRKL